MSFANEDASMVQTPSPRKPAFGGFVTVSSMVTTVSICLIVALVILLEPIGLIGFAWTSVGPPQVHWIAPMIFSCLVGIANYSIYQSSIDYTVAAYGVYAASATGGNDFARDFLSGIAALYSEPMYSNIGDRPLEYASTILAIISLFVTVPVFYFYKKGPEIRMRSKFAREIEQARKEGRGGRPKTEGEEPTIPGHEHV